MSGFLWAHGHLGWGIFALVVFTGLWWLVADLGWRLWNVRASRLAVLVSLGWIIGAGVIILVSHLVSR